MSGHIPADLLQNFHDIVADYERDVSRNRFNWEVANAFPVSLVQQRIKSYLNCCTPITIANSEQKQMLRSNLDVCSSDYLLFLKSYVSVCCAEKGFGLNSL